MTRSGRTRRTTKPNATPPSMPPSSERYNNLSILRGIDLSNIPTLRALMSCLATRPPPLLTLPDVKAYIECFGLPETAAGTVFRIFCAVRQNGEFDLLKRAVVRFAGAREGSDEEVLRAVGEVEGLAEERVLMSPTAHPAAYGEALEKFEEYPKKRTHSPSMPAKDNLVKSTLAIKGPKETPVIETHKKRKLEHREEEDDDEAIEKQIEMEMTTLAKKTSLPDAANLEIEKKPEQETDGTKDQNVETPRRHRTRGESAKNDDQKFEAIDMYATKAERRLVKNSDEKAAELE